MQLVYALKGGQVEEFLLPDHDQRVMDGVEWGHHYAVFTPAYWATQAWLCSTDAKCRSSFRLGQSLEEELAACLLGGYGIPAEVGLAAFYRVRDSGMLSGQAPTEDELLNVLTPPLEIESRVVRYRFARQRSRYLSLALQALKSESPPTNDDRLFRDWFLNLSGIGPKTASWITRNWLGSDAVAIVDIHVYRAGLLAGFYRTSETPSKHYFQLEEKFLKFARSINVRASFLDALIWRHMKDAGNLVFRTLNQLDCHRSEFVN